MLIADIHVLYIYIFRKLVTEDHPLLWVYITIRDAPVFPLTEHHAMKAYWGNGGTASPIVWPRH